MDGVLLLVHARNGAGPDGVDSIYEEIAFRFLEHFAWITYAMDHVGGGDDEMWDEADGFMICCISRMALRRG